MSQSLIPQTAEEREAAEAEANADTRANAPEQLDTDHVTV